MRPFSVPSRPPRGIALLMVIAVLAALMAIVAPFAFSMFQHGRSASNDTAQQTAREGAEGAVWHAIGERIRTQRSIFADPDPEVTTLQDLRVSMEFPSSESAKRFNVDMNVQDPRGMLWSAKIEDEQGKINLNSAPPALLGNLLASALLTEGVKRGETQLNVDDASMFNRNGGLVTLVGEPQPLRYTDASNNSITLESGVLYEHTTGALVFDGRAWLITAALMPGGPAYVPYRSVYEIKAAPGLDGICALPPEDFARIERHLTVENGMNSPLWGRGQKLADQALQGSVTGVALENGLGFCPGTLVRIVTDGVPTGFSHVRTFNLRNDLSATLEFDTPISGSSGDTPPPSPEMRLPRVGTQTGTTYDNANQQNGMTLIEAQLKNPVNINTASDEVLAAVFTGVCLRANKYAVSRQVAIALVDYLRGRAFRNGDGQRPVFRSNDDLRKALYRARDNNIISLPQRDALVINATEPNSAKLRLCTVPFCYFSHGSYTFEGSAIANSDTGQQLAMHTIRQQANLPVNLPGRFRLQYQSGFQELIDQGMTNRVVTFPVALGKHHFFKDAPLNKFARTDSGNVRPEVGESGSMQGKQSNTSEWIEHCNDELDSRYGQEGYDLSKGEAFTQPSSGQAGFRNIGTPASGVELWYRPKGSGQCIFYDEGRYDDRDRVAFSYDPGVGLVVRVWDSTLNGGKKKPVEFDYPISLNTGDWYHVAASWKTSHPGGQDIRVDAQPFPNNDPTQLQFKPGGRLGSDLTVDDISEVKLEDGDGDDFPKSGALKIGEEVIEYSAHSGNTFSQLYRGARMSAAIRHKSGEWVIPFGFVNELNEELYAGKATLVEDLPMLAKCMTRIQLPPAKPPKPVLDSDTKMPVEDASDFPSSGFVTCEGELIYYGAKAKAGNSWQLQKLIRAQKSGNSGTAPARNLHDKQPVNLASVIISNSTDYPDHGIVQIDDEKSDKKVEWIYYADKQIMNGKHYLTAQMVTGNGDIRTGFPETVKHNVQNMGIWQVQDHSVLNQNGDPKYQGGELSFRNEFGIGDYAYLATAKGTTSSHAKKAKVIHVVAMTAAHCGGWDPFYKHDSPYGDQGVSEVSVVERGAQNGEIRYVKQAYLEQYPIVNPINCAFIRWEFSFHAGLDDFTQRHYPAHTGRYLHWPTGELPDAPGVPRYICIGKNGDGKVSGDVDELRVNTLKSAGGRIAMNLDGTGLAAGDEQILIEDYDAWAAPNGRYTEVPLQWPTVGGLIRIDDELMYYKSSGGGNSSYYADTYGQLKDKPPERNKADRRWINCQGIHELHQNLVRKGVTSLSNVKRGVLGTKAKDHPVGSQIMLLDAMAVSHLTGPLNSMADSFMVADASGFPPEGYAWINQEVLSWKKNNSGTFSGCEHFRGRYGTSAMDHEADDIVRCLPFRYWDRDPTEYDGDGLVLVQSGYHATGARWSGLDLDLIGTEEQPRPTTVVPHVLIRFDGAPNWDATPTNAEGGLFEFVGRNNLKFAGLEGGGVKAAQMEVRVFWRYLSGAFRNGAGMDWKRTFSIEKERGIYGSPLIMRRLDEIEKR